MRAKSLVKEVMAQFTKGHYQKRDIAIKISKETNKIQVKEFINEIVILARLNHENVVKLLGCCLATPVPILVYEFITRGTLFHRIHGDERQKFVFSWEDRLRIVVETAGALAYLHSAGDPPIVHGDIKSMNILLDDKFTAKVSDFGASRLVPLNQMQSSTFVQGTFGYINPEYMKTRQLTDKSDVYSFGAVLVELLTGKKIYSNDRPEERKNIAKYFVLSMKQNRLFDILEDAWKKLYAASRSCGDCRTMPTIERGRETKNERSCSFKLLKRTRRWVIQKSLRNRVSRSDVMVLGTPCKRTIFLKNNLAVVDASAVFLHGRK
ncbi:PREDICTED: putative wall-associated receptor kinase-like 16 [Nelumbo nucifera]|uniref:Wall-associated receptor kinase-like 16 n=1 Tax=Nelumbo nucifera TaxID=4432 RepID=A0A1U7ZJ36_NELNU|nr:PREDICTED: putative wall-associated receptor kinase-like 16 [Nelumbo nucifera]